MTMAHSFNQLGALHLHFVPIQNNLPLGSDPDVYLHWPPLFPLLLSFVTRILGDHESSARLFALAITLATACVVLAIARRLYGTAHALLSGFFFSPPTAIYDGGRAILDHPLTKIFGIRHRPFLPPGKSKYPPAAEQFIQPQQTLRRLSAFSSSSAPSPPSWTLALSHSASSSHPSTCAAATPPVWVVGYLIANVITFIAVHADYILAYPALFRHQFATIAYRAGLKFDVYSSLRLHTIVDTVHYSTAHFSFLGTYSHILRWLYESFGNFYSLAPFLFLDLLATSPIADKTQQRSTSWAASAPWLLYYVYRRNDARSLFALVLGDTISRHHQATCLTSTGTPPRRNSSRQQAMPPAARDARCPTVDHPNPLFIAERKPKIPFHHRIPGRLRHHPAQHSTKRRHHGNAESSVPTTTLIARSFAALPLCFSQACHSPGPRSLPGSLLFFAIQDIPERDLASFTDIL